MGQTDKYLKEVKADLERCLAEVKDNPDEEQKSLAEEILGADEIREMFDDSELQIQKEKARLHKLPPKELAQWIMDKHDSFVELFNYSINPDFLNGSEYFDRYCIIIYMQQLNVLLSVYEIELNDEMVAYLKEKNYADLLSFLNVLNFF